MTQEMEMKTNKKKEEKKRQQNFTYRDWNVRFVIACVQLPSEFKNCVGWVFAAGEEFVVLWRVHDWLAGSRVGFDVAILENPGKFLNDF